MRTHPFTSVDGRRVVVVDDGSFPVLKTSDGLLVQRVNITGPEILKLAAEGRALWKALDSLLSGAAGLLLASPVAAPKRRADLRDIAKAALAVLDETAPTFDHNETKEGRFDAEHEHCPVNLKRDAPRPLMPSEIVTAVRKEAHRGED